MSKSILVPIADGTEEIEAVCIIDTLRRAQLEVTVASVGSQQIKASRGVNLVADALIADCQEKTWDMIALPGGMPGSQHLADCIPLIDLLKAQQQAGRWIAAICAAPAVVLQAHGLLEGITATCYPALWDNLNNASTERVVIDQQVITGQGPGVALDFALTLVEMLADKGTRQKLMQDMLVN